MFSNKKALYPVHYILRLLIRRVRIQELCDPRCVLGVDDVGAPLPSVFGSWPPSASANMRGV